MVRWVLMISAFGIIAAFLACSESEKPKKVLSTKRSASQPPALQTMTAVQRGQIVYQKYGCGMCHGNDAKKGIKNRNSQTDEIPGLIYVKESYLPKELRARILNGVKFLPLKDPKKPPPPYRMPGWRGWMTDQELNDLCEYLFSLMPKETKEEKW